MLTLPCACHACSEEKVSSPWTEDVAQQATAFYLRSYIASFTRQDVAAAYASIPSVSGPSCTAHEWEGWQQFYFLGLTSINSTFSESSMRLFEKEKKGQEA